MVSGKTCPGIFGQTILYVHLFGFGSKLQLSMPEMPAVERHFIHVLMVPKNSAIIEVQSVLLSQGAVSATMLCSMHRAGSHSFDLAQALMTLESWKICLEQLLGLVIQENMKQYHV